MSEKVIYNLLSTNTALVAVVPVGSIYASLIPLNAVLPAIAYSAISTTQDTSIDLTTIKYRARVQITVACKTYAQVKQIISLIKTACNNKQGTYNGVKADSVILDNIGADFRDDDVAVFYQTIDFIINYSE